MYFEKEIKNKNEYNYFAMKNTTMDWYVYIFSILVIILQSKCFLKRKIKIETKCINESVFEEKKIRNRN